MFFQIITTFENKEQMPGLMDRKSMQRIFDQLAKEKKLKLCEVVVNDKVVMMGDVRKMLRTLVNFL